MFANYQEVAWKIFHPLSHKKCDPQHGWTNFPGTSLLDVYIAEIPKRNSSTLINFQEYWGLRKPSETLIVRVEKPTCNLVDWWENLLAISTNCWENLLAISTNCCENLIAISTNWWENLLAISTNWWENLLAIWTSHIRMKWRVIPCPRLIFSETGIFKTEAWQFSML